MLVIIAYLQVPPVDRNLTGVPVFIDNPVGLKVCPEIEESLILEAVGQTCHKLAPPPPPDVPLDPEMPVCPDVPVVPDVPPIPV